MRNGSVHLGYGTADIHNTNIAMGGVPTPLLRGQGPKKKVFLGRPGKHLGQAILVPSVQTLFCADFRLGIFSGNSCLRGPSAHQSPLCPTAYGWPWGQQPPRINNTYQTNTWRITAEDFQQVSYQLANWV